MASYDTGYEDELFEQTVSPSFHCIICTNVIKDPVACRHNEHIFCRACITEHLKNHQTCPSCMDPLTVGTLSQAPRGIRNLLAELKIRCKFFDRGCGKFIELGNLESHLRECGFAPAVCSNEGCKLEVNKRDLLYHETAVCEQRRVKCHSCNDIRQEMDMVKVNLAAINLKLKRIETNGKAVEENLVAKVELVQEQLSNQEGNNRQVQRDIVEMKRSLNKITKQLEKMTQQSSEKVKAEQEQMKKGIVEATEMGIEPKVVIAGGRSNKGKLSSVEIFDLSNGKWTKLQPMRECRSSSSSVVYNNHCMVTGGWLKSIEKLSLDAVRTDQSTAWENVAAELPGALAGHCSVVYNERLIVIGGYDQQKWACANSITEISLRPPYTSKVLTTMPQKRCSHGVAMFGNKIVIVGGRESIIRSDSALRTVVMYDISTNKLKELAPLPYPVSDVATVKWGDDNVIIMGGLDSNGKPLNIVLIYNVKTEKSHMLPDMKYQRNGCVAAVVKDTVIVMGGQDERSFLKSVECFRFDCYTWEELPEMKEERCLATAVSGPKNRVRQREAPAYKRCPKKRFDCSYFKIRFRLCLPVDSR